VVVTPTTGGVAVTRLTMTGRRRSDGDVPGGDCGEFRDGGTLVMNPAALAFSVVVLVAALLSALTVPRRMPPAAVAVARAVLLTSVGAVGWSDAGSAVRQIAPTVGFLVLVLLLGHLADREGCSPGLRR
jgi:hypothetical protein